MIATSAEEAMNPSFSVPVGIIGSLLICGCCYMGVAGIITLMVPYAQISVTAPLPGDDDGGSTGGLGRERCRSA